MLLPSAVKTCALAVCNKNIGLFFAVVVVIIVMTGVLFLGGPPVLSSSVVLCPLTLGSHIDWWWHLLYLLHLFLLVHWWELCSKFPALFCSEFLYMNYAQLYSFML